MKKALKNTLYGSALALTLITNAFSQNKSGATIKASKDFDTTADYTRTIHQGTDLSGKPTGSTYIKYESAVQKNGHLKDNSVTTLTIEAKDGLHSKPNGNIEGNEILSAVLLKKEFTAEGNHVWKNISASKNKTGDGVNLEIMGTGIEFINYENAKSFGEVPGIKKVVPNLSATAPKNKL